MKTTEVIHAALNAERVRRGKPQVIDALMPEREAGEALGSHIARARAAYGLPVNPLEPSASDLSDKPMPPLVYHSVADETGPAALVSISVAPADYRDRNPGDWLPPLNVGADHAGSANETASIAAKAYPCPNCGAAVDANCVRSGRYRSGSHSARMALVRHPAATVDPSMAAAAADYEARCADEAAHHARRARSAEVPEWHMTRAARVARGLLLGMHHRVVDAEIRTVAGVLVRPLPKVTTVTVQLPDGRTVDNYVIAGDSVDRINRMLDGIATMQPPTAEVAAMQAPFPPAPTAAHPTPADLVDPPHCHDAPPAESPRITCIRGIGTVSGAWRATDFAPTTLYTMGARIGLERGSDASQLVLHRFAHEPHSPASMFDQRVASAMQQARDALPLGKSLPSRAFFEASQRASDLMDDYSKAKRRGNTPPSLEAIDAAIRATLDAAAKDARQ